MSPYTQTQHDYQNTALGLAEALLSHSTDSSCGHSAPAGGPWAWEGHQGNEPTTGQTPTRAGERGEQGL